MAPSQRPPTMRAVIYKSPFHVALETRPTPSIQKPTDVILKVTASAICGSDLHWYRGHQNVPPGFIIGHEFVGIIDEMGSEVQGKGFDIGDEVIVPFFTSCGDCFYCTRGWASRCERGLLFGNSAGTNSISGGDADYVLVPFAPTTMLKAPPSIPRDLLVLMSDIFPTGYFAASRFLKPLSPAARKACTAVLIGCGPVGICALVSALTFVDKIYAVDIEPARLAEAEKLGAIPIPPGADAAAIIKAATGGRGADVVFEVVGRADALKLAVEAVRPWGSVSSVGVYTEELQLSGPTMYGKNLTVAWGRCPVRSIFEEALGVFETEHHKVAFLAGKKMKMEDCEEAFKIFEERKVHKVVFDME